ncbi:hypothetical protein BH09SUM1_BH09SUM1_23310 [soil metagenome]
MTNPPTKPLKRWALRIARSAAIAVGCFYLIACGALVATQNGVIYFPRAYDVALAGLGKQFVPLTFRTKQGAQTAFYIPPAEGERPDRLWVLFNGNGSQALDWEDFVQRFPDPHAGFLLYDYPGYGYCEGTPSPGSVKEGSDGALAALGEKLNVGVAELESHMGVVGHSIGAGFGLEFAARHPVERVVIISPFTSLDDMARRKVGWLFSWVLMTHLDNRARLNELAARSHAPRVLLIHGTNDQIVPVAMGRELAAAHPDMITFVEVPKGDHSGIVFSSRSRSWQAMTEVLIETEKVRQ